MLFLNLIRIFISRIVDVSLGTFRTILTVKGKTTIPTIIAFFEVLIWFYVAKEALLIDSNKLLVAISYSLGYASGNYIGTIISKEFINSVYEVKVYNPTNRLINYLTNNSYEIHIIRKNNLVIYIKNKNLYKLITTINKLSKKSIIYISETKVNNNLQNRNIML